MHPLTLDRNKFDAQVARQGARPSGRYKISPILWTKVRRGLTPAGPVGGGALWFASASAKCALRTGGVLVADGSVGRRLPPPFKAKLVQWKNQKVDNKKFRLENDATVQAIVNPRRCVVVIGDVEKKERRRYPAPPFVHQQTATGSVRKLGFSPSAPCSWRKQLSEGVELGSEGSVGLITYMRTDSTRISDDAIGAVRGFIQGQYGRTMCRQAQHLRSRKALRMPMRRSGRLNGIYAR